MAVSRLLCVGLIAALGACATSAARPVVNLAPARAAVEDAREAGAPKNAPETFNQAELHLKEAERLAAVKGHAAREEAIRAEGMAQLATAEARCAAAASRLAATIKTEQTKRTTNTADLDRANARFKKSEEEQRRLEERVALLMRDLELTETEIIRTKARLKGIETRAEASSAIAEARILTGRLDPKARAATVSLCNENIAKAEAQLTATPPNYGAAVFFATKAQDIAKKAQEGSSDSSRHGEDERAAAQPTYRVKAKTANIRKGPDVAEEVLAEAPEGSTLAASASKGDWVKVTYNGTTGWVSRSVLE